MSGHHDVQNIHVKLTLHLHCVAFVNWKIYRKNWGLMTELTKRDKLAKLILQWLIYRVLYCPTPLKLDFFFCMTKGYNNDNIHIVKYDYFHVMGFELIL